MSQNNEAGKANTPEANPETQKERQKENEASLKTNDNNNNTIDDNNNNNDNNNVENTNTNVENTNATNLENTDTNVENTNNNDNTNQNKGIDNLTWDYTNIENLNVKDVIQLLRNRHSELKNLNNKEQKIKYLKETCSIRVDYSNLTKEGLLTELRLLKLNDEPAKKEILLARLNGEPIEEPPKKKLRVNSIRRKSSKIKNEVYISMYQSEAKNTDDNNNTNKNVSSEIECLGVFKDERDAYYACIDKLSDDTENKNKTEHSKIMESLDKLDDDDYKEKLETFEKTLQTTFGEKNPKVWVESKPLE